MVSFASNDDHQNLDELLRRAEQGEDVVILRDGCVVARLIPEGPRESRRVEELLKKIDQLRSTMPSLGEPIKKLADEGRA